MLVDVMAILFDGIDAVFSWFEAILNATETYYLVLGVIVLLIFWLLVIAPLFGGASFRLGSDRVRKSSNSDSNPSSTEAS